MKSKGEIIAETLAYYRTHPRGLRSSGACAYLVSEDGFLSYCAVGRCMTDEAKQIQKDNLGQLGTCADKIWGFSFGSGVDQWNRVEQLLKEEYKGHSYKFWQSLQELHDASYHWCGSELSEAGEDYLDKFLGEIEGDEYE